MMFCRPDVNMANIYKNGALIEMIWVITSSNSIQRAYFQKVLYSPTLG